jgi:hypothetical protein
MDGVQLREFHVPRLAIALTVIALVAAALAPSAGATSPSQDQYGSALPGVGGGNGSGSSSGSSSGGSAETTIPVAPSSSSSTGGSDTSSASTGSGGNGGGSSHHSKASQKTNHAKATPNSANLAIGTAQPTDHSVPHIAADSAGDSWVPWFIAGLLALAAAGGVLVYRNRRRAAQS